MKKYQVVGIGNSIVDVLSHIDEAFLGENGIEKGIMTLIDTDRASELYSQMGQAIEISGGSAANTIAGIAALGGRTAYVGKVKDDQLGEIFAHDIRAIGADYDVPLAPKDHSHETGRCLVLVSPDGERSMNTYLGVSEFLAPSDIDEAMMADAEWIYLEGYRFDGPDSHDAFRKAITACRGAGGKASLTLSDPFCVERHREAFRTMITESIDLLFANEHEMRSLYQTEDLEEALAQASTDCETVACTVGADGAIILQGASRVETPADQVKLVDATGAGDLFAAGFLYGHVNGAGLEICGKMGCTAASEIISHIGARPEVDLRALFSERGLLD